MFRLGVDVGGTFIKAGVIREDNTIVARVSVPTEADKPYKEVIGNIVRGAELAARQAGRELADFPCVGFGIPGLLNGRTGLVALAPNMGDWHQVPFLEEAQKHLPIPAYVGNDANCAVIGETLAGAARGCQDVLLLTLGTGVGGGAILDGRPIEEGAEEVKLRSRQYAKRQLTWFRRDPAVHWFFWGEAPDFSAALAFSTELIITSGLQ